MFAKLGSALLIASAFIAGTSAGPVPARELVSRTNHGVSFNNWGNIPAFNNFDHFYGVDNFSGHFTPVVRQEQHLVCHTQAVEIIQQRLVVLQEMAKRIVLEQICEVEVQTVVFQQFHASLGHFANDIHRVSGNPIGYDSNIASHFGNIVSSDGSLSSDNFGFSGSEIGGNTVVVDGSNWNDATSPASVSSAFGAANFGISN